MPFPKTRAYKSKRKYNKRRPRPSAYKGKRMMVLSRSIPAKSHIFKRVCNVVQITNSGIQQPVITTTAGGWNISGVQASAFGHTSQFGLSADFRLNDVTNAGDFTALFDRYKIVGVKLNFMYQSTSSDGSAPVSNVMPVINVAFDGDDSTLPTSQVEVQQKGYCKTHMLNPNLPFKTYWTPRVDKVIYQEGVSPAYSTERACWIDCNNSTVPHYGMKAWVTSWPYDLTIAGNRQPAWGELSIQPTYYIACKDTI